MTKMNCNSNTFHSLRDEVLPVALMKTHILWDATLCCWVSSSWHSKDHSPRLLQFEGQGTMILWNVRPKHPTKEHHIAEDFNLPNNLPKLSLPYENKSHETALNEKNGNQNYVSLRHTYFKVWTGRHKNIRFPFLRNEILKYSYVITGFYSWNHNKAKGYHYGSKKFKNTRNQSYCNTRPLFYLTHIVGHFLSHCQTRCGSSSSKWLMICFIYNNDPVLFQDSSASWTAMSYKC